MLVRARPMLCGLSDYMLPWHGINSHLATTTTGGVILASYLQEYSYCGVSAVQ